MVEDYDEDLWRRKVLARNFNSVKHRGFPFRIPNS